MSKSKRTARYEAPKAVTVRLSHADFIALLQEAEDRGTSNAEIIRKAWASYQEKSEVEHEFKRLETRIVKQLFEVCSATLGLSEEERKAARQEFNQRVKNGGKS